jgi:hypothetical protein
MGIFSFLSATKTADAIVGSVPKVIDGVIGGIDKAFFTDQEKAETIKDLLKQLYDNFMPRAISRRILAVIIFGVFAIYALTALVFACFKQTEVVNAIIATAEAFQLGWLAITVTIFYFGYYGFQKITGKDK